MIFLGLIPALAYISLQVPWIQTYAAKKAVTKIEQYIDGKASIDKLIIIFYNRVILQEVTITGMEGDTLAHIGKLTVNVSTQNILRGNIKAHRVTISDGHFLYSEEENHQSNISRIFKIDNNKKKDSKRTIPDIYLGELRIKNFDFRYKSLKKPEKPVSKGCMDYTDIFASDINARINRISHKKGKITCRIHKLSCSEKCGINLHELKGFFSMDSRSTSLENMTLKDDYSTVTAKYLSFGYKSGNDTKDFVNKISLGADLRGSTVDFRTIAFFTPSLAKSTLSLTVSGIVSGPVSNMKISSLNVKSSTGRTIIDLSTTMKGLPDINKTVFNGYISSLSTNAEDIATIIASFQGEKPNNKISSISKGDNYLLSCIFDGSINKMKASGDISSPSAGKASFNVSMLNSGKINGLSLKGKIRTEELNLGKIINVKNIGRASVTSTLEAIIKDKKHGGTEIRLDSLNVKKFGFNDYNYSNIFAVGNYSSNKFDGRIISHDPNLHFILQGVFSLSDITQDSEYNCYADISFADLAALNLVKDGNVSQISLRTIANISINKKKELIGDININNLTYWNETGENNIGSIYLNSVFKDNNYVFDFNSSFLNAKMTTTGSPVNSINRLTNILIYNQFSNIFTKKTENKPAVEEEENGEMNFSLQTFNMKPVCNILSNGLYIADSTTLSISLNKEDSLMVALDSKRIGLKTNSIKNISLLLKNRDSLLLCGINSESLNFGNIKINNNRFDITSGDGVINLKYLYENEGEHTNKLSFSTDVFFDRDISNDLRTNISINESELFFENYRWIFTPCNIRVSKKNYVFDNFSLRNQDQKIKINGCISSNPSDTMKVDLDNFDISIINSLFSNDMKLSGFFTGEAFASNLFGDPNIIMNISGNDVSIFENQVGKLNILSKWDKSKERINLLVSNKYMDSAPLNISGYYQPKGRFINLNVSLSEFTLTYLEPFINNILTDISGSITGDLELIGTFDKLNLTSYNTKFDDFHFTPAFTKVPYILNGPIEMSETGVSFMGVEVKDQYHNSATLSGGINHRFFKDIYLDTKLSFKNLQCLDTKEGDNQTFYGTAYGSGMVNITGPINDLFMDVIFATDPKSSIHIPLSSSASATNSDLLSFTQKTIQNIDPYEEEFLSKEKKSKEKFKFELKAKANVTSDTELFIEINKQLGDILKCKGSGTIDIDVNPSRDILDLKGDYTIDEGSYKFVLLGLTAKDFIINHGGNIAFNGGIMNTSLNVGATYRTKASISTLISDTSSVGNRRNVDCGLHISGSIMNPNLSFSIDVPDLDPITKGRVESALSTADKVQKQFMALLISGSFVPDEQSGIVNNSTILYSNAGEMLSNQFNNVFRQLGIPLDLGLNYQPGDKKGKDMFDVALSYQAFNNRVVINGNVGNSANSSKSWMGNFEAEVKIDKKGKFRINAFTRSADDYSNYLDNTQRNGIGFTYQDEFDTFGELYRSIFYSKKRREAYETQQILEAEKALIKEAKEAEEKEKQILKPKESPYRFY